MAFLVFTNEGERFVFNKAQMLDYVGQAGIPEKCIMYFTHTQKWYHSPNGMPPVEMKIEDVPAEYQMWALLES